MSLFEVVEVTSGTPKSGTVRVLATTQYADVAERIAIGYAKDRWPEDGITVNRMLEAGVECIYVIQDDEPLFSIQLQREEVKRWRIKRLG